MSSIYEWGILSIFCGVKGLKLTVGFTILGGVKFFSVGFLSLCTLCLLESIGWIGYWLLRYLVLLSEFEFYDIFRKCFFHRYYDDPKFEFQIDCDRQITLFDMFLYIKCLIKKGGYKQNLEIVPPTSLKKAKNWKSGTIQWIVQSGY